MKSLPDIQQLIDFRADRKLKDDLLKINETIQKMPILMENNSEFPKLQFGEKKELPRWFFGDGKDSFYEALYNYWLPIYKNREAQNFLADVERLKSDVNDLMNVTHENDY